MRRSKDRVVVDEASARSVAKAEADEKELGNRNWMQKSR